MAKVDFIKLEDEIRQILIENPKTREDDVYCLKQDTKFYNYDNFGLLFSQKEFRIKENIKTFGAVERSRRKIQANSPELESGKKTKKARAEKEEEYKEYSRL